MSIKGSITKSDYINYDEALNTGRKLLNRDKTSIFGLYIIVSINAGMRIGDVLQLTWEDLRNGEKTFREEKTGKARKVIFNETIKDSLNAFDYREGLVFLSQKGGVFTRQQINRKLKQVFFKKGYNISSHSLRKTFGRRVYEVSNESERALLDLMNVFNHSSLAVTKEYLGIRQEEINDVYLRIV